MHYSLREKLSPNRFAIIILISLSILVEFSCSKEELDNCVTVGKKSGMVVSKIDSALGFWAYVPLDLDNNNKDDIAFSFGRGSGGLGVPINFELTISSLHDNVFITHEEDLDTIYITKTITVTTDSNPMGLFPVKQINKSYTCDPVPNIDSVYLSGPEEEVRPLRHGQELCRSSGFKIKTSTLWKEDWVSPPYFYHSGDTSFIETRSGEQCVNFPGGERYIGFKIRTGDQVKLGWVKVDMSRNFIYETAIQE